MRVNNKKKSVITSSKESEVYKKLKEKYGEELLNSFLNNINENFESLFLEFAKNKASIPDYIFVEETTVLESIVKYLKENLDLSYKQIADAINRDTRNIWHIYDSANRKIKEKFVEKESKFSIPLQIFSNRKLSIQENLVFYLKSEFNLSYHEIALLIKRDDRTVWTVYQKAKRKYEAR